MNLGGVRGLIYRVTEWIYKLALVNIIWIVFTICGLILFGVGPSTAGLYAILRKWINGQTDVPVFKMFFFVFKREFFRANLLCWSFGLIFFILYLDFRFISGLAGPLSVIGNAVLFSFFFIVSVTFLYSFPVNAHFEMNLRNCIKTAFVLSLSQLPFTLLMILCTFFIFFLMKIYPGIILFFGISILGFVQMWFAQKGLNKLGNPGEHP